MELKFQIICPCSATFSIGSNISVDKVVCPNCGEEYPYSDKVVSILKTASEIPHGKMLDKDFFIKIATSWEDTHTQQ